MCRGEVGSQMVWSREAGRRRGRAWERWMRARSSKKERTGVCDVIQSPLSPLPHTHTPCLLLAYSTGRTGTH